MAIPLEANVEEPGHVLDFFGSDNKLDFFRYYVLDTIKKFYFLSFYTILTYWSITLREKST